MCGAPNEDDATYCGNCGAALTLEDAVAEAPQEATAEGVPEAEAADETAEKALEATFEGTEVEASPEEALLAPVPIEEVEAEPPPPPAPDAPPAPARTTPSLPTSGLAIASLVLGVGGLTILPLLGSIVAIILGYMARREIRDRPGEVSGDGLALAGIVLGWIAVGLAVLGFLFAGAIGICGVCAAFGGNY
jgi:hypothetical protein